MLIRQAEERLLDKLAFTCEGEAKQNIRDNDQVDTGFMMNSVYAVSAERNDYNQTWSTGNYPWKLEKHGGYAGTTYCELAPRVGINKHESACVVGAHYAIYQEMNQTFLYKAFEDTAKRFGAILKTVKLR